MNKQVLTWDGNNIQDATYEAHITMEEDVRGAADAIWSARPSARPRLAGKNFGGVYLPLMIRLKSAMANWHSNWSTLKRWFDLEEESPKYLVIQDTADSNKQWRVSASPTTMERNGNRILVNLALDKPYWETVTEDPAAWNITASGQTRVVTVGGNRKTRPRLRIKPTSAKTGSYLYAVFIPVRNPTSRTLTNYPFDLTGAAFATNTLIGAGKMQADGDDLRTWVNGMEVYRWLSGFNTANTKVWVNLNLSPGHSATLGVAIASSGALTTVTASSDISGFPSSGMFQIGSEMYTYTEKDNTSRQFRGTITRSAKNTSMAAHSIGDPIYWIEHDIWIRYGLASATAPAVDNAYQPIINLDASTNASHVYANFMDAGRLRSGIFTNAYNADSNGGPRINTHTANHSTYAEPASELGITDNGRSTTTAGFIDFAHWTLIHQVGFTNWNFSNGEKYRPSTKWFRYCYIKADSGESGAAAVTFNIATPSASETWQAWSDSRALGGTYHSLQMYADFSGGTIRVGGCAVEAADLTLTLPAGNIPIQSIGAELSGQYYLTGTLTNNTTGDKLVFNYQMELNQTIELDCESMSAVYLKDNSNAFAAFTRNPARAEWMDMPVGSNTFQWDEAGAVGLTIDIYHRDRESA